MKLPATTVAALSLSLAVQAHGQTQQMFTDPANLRGERVAPRTGRELPIEEGVLGLQQMLRKLNTRASLMLIVAHPDDEDGGMLTYYSRGQGARVASLTLTRGEGGQNAMTGDFEDALGLIRTQELLAADHYFGVDQFFGTEVDFGFSKTKEEAFRKWTHERVLYDAVRAVRLYRPLVIAAVFSGSVTDGHGQHQVSGEIAQEVFKAAADPTVFPELTREGILPWQPLKGYARIPGFAISSKGLFDYATNQYTEPRFTNYVTGQTSATPPTADVTIHEGETDRLLTLAAARSSDLRITAGDPAEALSYVQFARIGLGLQRTQIGPGVRLASRGTYDVSYHRYGSRLPDQSTTENSFFDGIDTSVRGIGKLSSAPPARLTATLTQLAQILAGIAQGFDPRRPAAIAVPLVTAQHQLGALLYSLEDSSFPGKADVLHELRVKQVQLNQALALALGLKLKATTDSDQADVLQGSTGPVQTTLTSGAAEPVGLYAEFLGSPESPHSQRLLAVDKEETVTPSRPFAGNLQIAPELTAKITRPYFFRDNIEQPVYQLSDPALRNAPATPAPLVAWATLRYHQTEVQVGSVVNAQADQGEQAVEVVPPASVLLPSRAAALPPAELTVPVDVRVSPPNTEVQLKAPAGWQVVAPSVAGQAAPGRLFHLVPPHTGRDAAVVAATATPPAGKPQHEGFLAVGYPGLARTNFFTPATLKLVPVDLQLPKRQRVGYLPGTGDSVADNLRSVGFQIAPLTVADLTPDRLKAFDTVILGVRTYNAHPDLHGAPTEALFDFARRGGNVVVQYQTAEFTGEDAPYPLSLGSAEKVVDEAAPVRLLQPSAPALTTPNRLTEADFHGWVEERGHGFLQSWDPRYAALTETHDPGVAAEHVASQEPQRGGLVTTNLGQGHWTYVAFALYRQLPEAVPGAFRLFTNLIGLADTK